MKNIDRNITTKPNTLLRIFACLIDYSIIYAFTFYLVFTFGEPNAEGNYSLNGLPALIPVAFWLLMTVGTELLLGATIGNYFASLKAVPLYRDSLKLTFGESLKRHLLDPIDMFFFGLVGIITINNTKKNQRVGDLWAKTIVVNKKELNM